MRGRVLVVAWTALAALASGLGAQRPLSLGLAGGVSIPQGDLGDEVDIGWHALGTLALGSLMQPMGLRLDGAYHRFAFSDGAAAGGDARETAVSVTLNLTYRLPMTSSPLSPYLIAGLGGYRTGCGGGVSCEASTDVGWNAGLGTKLHVLGVRSFAEARLHSASREGLSVRFVPLTLGVMF